MHKLKLIGAALLAAALAMTAQAASAMVVGAIYACYACQASGDPTVDAALTANPSVAVDGLLFEFTNTSATAITGGTFNLQGAGYSDVLTLPTLAAHSSYIFLPGLSSDGGVHPTVSLFYQAGYTQDTSDGEGSVNDSSIFSFTGAQGLLAVTSGSFTPGDAALIKPYRDNPLYSTSFIGYGPNGDGGCVNCYFGQIASLSVPSTVSGVPEPASWAIMLIGLGGIGGVMRLRQKQAAAAA